MGCMLRKGLCITQVVLREAENAGATLDLESKSSASDITSPMSPVVS